jgi:hypothetical protein
MLPNPNWMVARVLAAAGTSTVMVGVFVLILFVLPRPLPALRGEVRADPRRPDGTVETRYWVGLLKERWTYRDGKPHGLTVQYYPNGSIYRELFYVDGKLSGPANEYRELPLYRGSGRRRAPRRRRESFEKGPLRATWHYVGGAREGPYRIFYEDGTLKEEGAYRAGRPEGVVRTFSRKGELLSEKDHGIRAGSGDSLLLDRAS